MARITTSLANAQCISVQWILFACWLLAPLAGFCNVAAQEMNQAEVIEQEVKAAYLFKFGGFIEWPDQKSTSQSKVFTIGVIEEDSVADALARIATGRMIKGRPVAVRKMRRNDPVADLNVLFIGRLNNPRINEILARAREHSILTVTESADALALGSMINFLTIGGKLRFEVAPKNALLSKLSISARLLAAAYKVAPEAS